MRPSGYWLLSTTRSGYVDALHDQFAVGGNFLLALGLLAALPDLAGGPVGERGNRQARCAIDGRGPELDHLVVRGRGARHTAIEQVDALQHFDLWRLAVDL